MAIQINSNSNYRYAIVFASRAVADEWWHVVSTSAIVKFSNSIRRANAADSLAVNGVATQLPWQGGRQWSVIPPLHFADHISENSSPIKVSSFAPKSPYEYWYCPLLSDSNATNLVYISRTERTRFRVGLTDKGTAGAIMIGSDEIVITLPSLSRSIRVTGSGQVILSTAPELGLKFSDLLSKFTVGPTLYKDGQSLDTRELFYTDDGEEWELA
ncbi:hypothetical protein BDR05DRAFT_948728 [Suillus weaverae]|nr:hypothetical protein BDR05DRAFT_948728 [Suillus weaverae]